MIWAIVPFKGVASAKSRLALELNDDDRRRLALAMLSDVLDTLRRCQTLGGILLVSRSKEAPEIARIHGVKHYSDSAADLSDAITEASSYLVRSADATGTFFIPGDVPLITEQDVNTAIERHYSVTIIPDEMKTGTNGLLCSPPNRLPYQFDGRSFEPHLNAARSSGVQPEVLCLASFALDVDSVEDALRVRNLATNSRTARVIHSLKALPNQECESPDSQQRASKPSASGDQ